MNVSATAVRVLTQLRRDPRSLALVLLVPCVLEGLLKAMFADEPQIFQKIGPPLLGLFPFISMFLITSVTMLRERTSGTLERLMTMPIRKLDLLGGYGLAFGLLAAVQAAIVSARGLRAARPERRRAGMGGCGARGRKRRARDGARACWSALSRPRSSRPCSSCRRSCSRSCFCAGCSSAATSMARWLQVVAAALPLTYAYDALAKVAAGGPYGWRFVLDVGVTVGATLVALALAAATLKRRTP